MFEEDVGINEVFVGNNEVVFFFVIVDMDEIKNEQEILFVNVEVLFEIDNFNRIEFFDV